MKIVIQESALLREGFLSLVREKRGNLQVLSRMTPLYLIYSGYPAELYWHVPCIIIVYYYY